jgi:hypothetical protein
LNGPVAPTLGIVSVIPLIYPIFFFRTRVFGHRHASCDVCPRERKHKGADDEIEQEFFEVSRRAKLSALAALPALPLILPAATALKSKIVQRPEQFGHLAGLRHKVGKTFFDIGGNSREPFCVGLGLNAALLVALPRRRRSESSMPRELR